MIRILIVALAAAVANAAVLHNGSCPVTTPVADFNVSAYGGLWYEIGKFPTVDEQDGQCAKAEYTLLENGTVKVKNSHVVKGVLATIEGTAKLADDANNSAKLLVSLNFGAATTEVPLQVLYTDYTNYAIAYNCKFDDKTNSHTESLWILGRTDKLNADGQAAVDTFFKNNPEINRNDLVHTDFSEDACKYSSTSVVAERPKED